MFESRPLVSVCITAYNHGRYIRESLQSVLDQDGDFDIEILVGDDGSSDGTRAILSELADSHPGRMTPYFHSRNLGASGNLCFLVSRARGQFIAHLDGDDYWLPGKLKMQLNEMHRNPDVSAVYCNGMVINDGGVLIGTFNAITDRTPFNLKYLVEKGNFLLHSSVLYRSIHKDHILSIPGNFIDFRIHVRLSFAGDLVHLGEMLVMYRYSSASSMSKNMPYLVTACYWDALIDASVLGESLPAYRGAEIFWQKILLRSLASFDFINIACWWRIFSTNDEIGFSRARLVWLSLMSIKLIPLILRKRIYKSNKIILFPR